jgi:hypothetical protein
MRTLITLLAATALSSCATSLVYDPTLQLPQRHLEPGEVQIGAGSVFMPETRPDAVSRAGSIGISTMGRAAVNERLTIGGKHWFTFVSDDPSPQNSSLEYRAGLSGELWYNLDDSTSSLVARGAMLFGESGYGSVAIDGGGVGAQYARRFVPFDADVTLHAAAGLVFGFRDLMISSGNPQWGTGVLANFGGALNITGRLDLTADIAALVYYDANTEQIRPAVAPGLALSLTF